MTTALRPLLETHGASFISYGPPMNDGSSIEIVDTFGPYEAEYAAIRKGVGLLETPQRAVIEVTGVDRVDFLHRLVTNDVKKLEPGRGCRAFLLGRNGRILADLLVLHGHERTWLELDRFRVEAVLTELDGYLFSDDVQLRSLSDEIVALALHGPAAVRLLGELEPAAGEAANSLKSLSHTEVTLQGAAVRVYRLDDAGSLGLHLWLPREVAAAVGEAMAQVLGGLMPDVEGGVRRNVTGRGIGWLAYNTARIEAGWPIYCVDFGPDSLPHETGILTEAVSFTKGCYVGQEIVARMQSLGHPKRVLVGLRFDSDDLPVAGAAVIEPRDDPADIVPIGAVTSSSLSPLRGNQAVAFAVMKWGRHEPDTSVKVQVEGGVASATVQALRFLPGGVD